MLQSFFHQSKVEKIIKQYSKSIEKVQVHLQAVPLPHQIPTGCVFFKMYILHSFLLRHSSLTPSLETL